MQNKISGSLHSGVAIEYFIYVMLDCLCPTYTKTDLGQETVLYLIIPTSVPVQRKKILRAWRGKPVKKMLCAII